MDARRERDFVHFESRAHSRNWRVLADEGGAGRGGARDSLRGDELESAAGFFSGRVANGLQLVSGKGVASALGDACEGRRCVSDFLWRRRRDERALVARWKAVGVYFESHGKYRFVAAEGPGVRTTATKKYGTQISEGCRACAPQIAGRQGTACCGACFYNQCGRTFLYA